MQCSNDASVSSSSVSAASVMKQVNLLICVKGWKQLGKLNFPNKQSDNNSGLQRSVSLLCYKLLSQSCKVACEQVFRSLDVCLTDVCTSLSIE